MNLRHTILGLLSQNPASGYDLKRAIMESDIFPWSGNNNQVYKCLVELQDEGLLTCQLEVQANLPNKKIYTVTATGLAELQKALRQPPDPPEFQKDILMRLEFAGQLSGDAILGLLDAYEAEIQVQLKMHAARTARLENRAARSSTGAFLRERISSNLAGAYKAELDWLRETRDAMREFITLNQIGKADINHEPEH